MTASKALTEAQYRITALEKYVNELLDVLANKDGILESNHQQIQELFRTLAEQVSLTESRDDLIERQGQKIAALTKNLDEYQKSTEKIIRTKAERITSLRNAIQAQNRKINLQQDTITNLRNHGDNLQGEVYDLKDALEVKERQRVNIEKANDELQSLIKKIYLVTGISEDLSLAYALQTMKEDLTSAEKALAEKTILLNSYEAMVINPSANDARLRNIIARQDKHINKVEQELKQARVAIQIQDAGLITVKQQMSKKDAQAIEDRQTIRTLQNHVDNLEGRVAYLANQEDNVAYMNAVNELSTANLNIKRLSTTVNILAEENDRMETKITELDSMLRGARKLINIKQARIDNLTDQKAWEAPSCQHPCQCGCS